MLNSLPRAGIAVIILALTAGSAVGQKTKPSDELLKEKSEAGPQKFVPAKPEESAAMIEKAKARGEEVAKGLGISFQTIETPHFIIFTDWDRREHTFLKTNVELAYNAVSRQFDVPIKDNIFVGKLPVFMFAKKEDFQRHARQYDKFDVPDTVAGYYQGNSRGHGHMSMWKPDVKKSGGDIRKAEREWAYVLVHEFTHAFIARYRTNAFIPRWLNEGLAEVIASGQFPRPQIYPYVRERAKVANVQRLLKQDSLLEGEDYPVVQTLVETMIVGNRKGFIEFFNDVKDGVDFEEALQKHYKVGNEGLEQAWRKYIATKR